MVLSSSLQNSEVPFWSTVNALSLNFQKETFTIAAYQNLWLGKGEK